MPSLEKWALALVVLSIIVGMGAKVLQNMASQETTNTVTNQTLFYGLSAMSTFGTWFNTIVIIVIAVVIIALIVVGFRGASEGQASGGGVV
jgi:hypothetical protein